MTVLAVDIGGTKTLVTLVDGPEVLQRVEAPTERSAGPREWVEQVVKMAGQLGGKFDRAGITVSGLVKDNRWRTLNTRTLAIPGEFALMDFAEQALGVPVTLCNDAQAAAWGEFVYGAGQQKDIVFLTISTGVGGGVVANGRLLSGRGGLAGHFGQVLPQPDGDGGRFEDCSSGRWIADQGAEIGLPRDARQVFAAAAEGIQAAEGIIQTSAERVGRLCHNLQLMFDPHVTVIGGGVGMASGFLERVAASVEHLQPLVRPTLVNAQLKNDAGVIGVADLSKENQT